jgi:serine/threonine-protein kinase RsbW
MHSPRQDGSIELELRSDLAEVPLLQDHIAELLKARRFAQKDIFGIRLALEEALVNAIKHGNRLDPQKRVRVTYRVTTRRFEIAIADEGPGFQPERVADPLAPENLEVPGGRGLLLMRAYMTEVEFHPPGNRVTMAKVRVPAKAASNGKHEGNGKYEGNGKHHGNGHA